MSGIDLESKLSSIRKDIDNGLKTRAMNRLQGLINAYPNELRFREELGRLYLSVNWQERAGLHLLLTNPTDEAGVKAVGHYKRSVNNSGHKILIDLKFKGDIDSLPRETKDTLLYLEKKSLKETGTIPKFSHVSPNKTVRKRPKQDSLYNKLVHGFLIGILIAIPILAIIGIVQVLKWIF